MKHFEESTLIIMLSSMILKLTICQRACPEGIVEIIEHVGLDVLVGTLRAISPNIDTSIMEFQL